MSREASSLGSFIRRVGGKGVVFLTGAGCSTESGIPDYRGPQGTYRRADFVPLTFQKFMQNDYEKKRYWLRSMLGYSVMTGASCNPAHTGLHALQQSGVVSHIITQNVDGLHHLATHGGRGRREEGSYVYYTRSEANLTELHGNIHLVLCMGCHRVLPRDHLQGALLQANPSLFPRCTVDAARLQPDGDYVAPDSLAESVRLVHCQHCGGYLKPHVVLFGENVSKDVVTSTVEVVKGASCLVCMGTSLQVFSAYRYVLAAREAGVPVVIVNSGKTRADGMESLRIHTDSVAGVMTTTVSELLNISVDTDDESGVDRRDAIHTYS
ncbi:NAD dependent deacetylase [Angomonas deanei]|uniref:NAD-dependent protein deacylase n=1 Tax=Angomonas deanei TaxID=59799 RepID=S9U767_9TRYP|nr:NAD dependent deacetylase [Angomonas deanei]EPY31086.1 NAD dependent deacetylase [Angomonas deanei]EPY41590.1 NAD dependent deacetylase [Angomonas deanei]EPY42681.1 NAD dependent deacetylase [Angomonas deanei]CAD2220757.1 Sir2 family, putative [Angomonas deanei]|eukprot:EPY24609.1 NAD dependent deacetylase [Angomonas deanei]